MLCEAGFPPRSWVFYPWTYKQGAEFKHLFISCCRPAKHQQILNYFVLFALAVMLSTWTCHFKVCASVTLKRLMGVVVKTLCPLVVISIGRLLPKPSCRMQHFRALTATVRLTANVVHCLWDDNNYRWDRAGSIGWNSSVWYHRHISMQRLGLSEATSLTSARSTIGAPHEMGPIAMLSGLVTHVVACWTESLISMV